MYKAILFSTLLAVLMLVIPDRASAQVERFQGRWKSTNRNAHYLLKLEVAVHGADVEVSAWSACHEPFESHCSRFATPSFTSSVEFAGSVDFNSCAEVRQSVCGPVYLGRLHADIYATSDSDNLAGKASALLLTYQDWLVILESQGDKLSATVFSQGKVEHDFFKKH